jgi:hypothetical protein
MPLTQHRCDSITLRVPFNGPVTIEEFIGRLTLTADDVGRQRGRLWQVHRTANQTIFELNIVPQVAGRFLDYVEAGQPAITARANYGPPPETIGGWLRRQTRTAAFTLRHEVIRRLPERFQPQRLSAAELMDQMVRQAGADPAELAVRTRQIAADRARFDELLGL